MSRTTKSNQSVHWSRQVPDNLANDYWPCKEGTIPAAVRWFRQVHGVPPQRVVSKSKDWSTVQDVYMWARSAPNSSELYFRETYGQQLGAVRYREAVSLALFKKKARKGKVNGA